MRLLCKWLMQKLQVGRPSQMFIGPECLTLLSVQTQHPVDHVWFSHAVGHGCTSTSPWHRCEKEHDKVALCFGREVNNWLMACFQWRNYHTISLDSNVSVILPNSKPTLSLVFSWFHCTLQSTWASHSLSSLKFCSTLTHLVSKELLPSKSRENQIFLLASLRRDLLCCKQPLYSLFTLQVIITIFCGEFKHRRNISGKSLEKN